MALSKDQLETLRELHLRQKATTTAPTVSATPSGTNTPVNAAEPQRGFLDKLKDFAGGAVYGVSAPGRTIQNLVSSGVDKVFGTQDFGKATKAGFESSTGTDLDTTSAKVGEFAGQTASMMATGGAAGAATKGLGMGAQALAQGTAAATTQAAQTGEIGRDEATAFLFGSLSVPAAKGLQIAGQKLTQDLPEWLVKPLLKQAKDAKVQGRDIAPFLLKTGRVGTVDSLIKQTDDVINSTSQQVDTLLQQSSAAGVTVTKGDILDDVVTKINAQGGEISADDVAGVIEKLAPQAKGLLKKDTLTLVEANKLRSSIDKTLGDRGFLVQQLPFNKQILKDFTNTLREAVKANGDDSLRPLFDDYAKNIRLRDALIERAASANAANSVGLYDILAGATAFGTTGNPMLAVAAMGARRGLESGLTKTAAAKALTNSANLAPALEKLAPASRAIVLEFLSSLAETDQTTTQQ